MTKLQTENKKLRDQLVEAREILASVDLELGSDPISEQLHELIDAYLKKRMPKASKI